MSPDERRRIRHAFDGAAQTYEAHAKLQREIAEDLALATHAYAPIAGAILDAGCGTGFGAQLLHRLFPQTPLINVDLAPAMAAQTREHSADVLCADLEAIPLPVASVGLYWSSLAWQWCDSRRAAREAARVLAPGGTAVIATLGPQTLLELRQCFAQIDNSSHVRLFDAPEKLYSGLIQAGFRSVRMARSARYAHAPDLATLMRGIRAIGAHTVDAKRRSGLMGKGTWNLLRQHYEFFRQPAGLPARYDVICIHAQR